MLSILLTVLKVIGIVLAVLLGLVIALLLILLYVPVRYEVLAKYADNKPYAKVNVTALFKIVRCRFEYIDSVSYWVKVLWFKVYPKDDESDGADSKSKKSGAGKDKNKKDKQKDKKRDKKSANVFDEESSQDESFFDPGNLEYQMSDTGSSSNVNAEKSSDTVKTQNAEQSQEAKQSPDIGQASDSLSEKHQQDESTSFFERLADKIRSVYEKIKEALLKIKSKLVSTWDSVKQKKEDATDKVNDIIRIVNDEGNREFVKFVWEQLKYLFKKLKPRKGRLYVHFGMDDPETTGKIAMYLAVLYGLMGIDISILPDFEEKVMEGELYLKGRLQLVTILIIAVRLYRNKHFKRIVLNKEL